ncbi:MAG: aminotransferase class III-fold pyridoxal phosphate-dependent enzyme [Chloroflexi bacterium]|nr:aminotransferase class III-fold pyridoxal phosphate-dependent enzyme [Chloroflexota bacterium]
MAQVQSVSLDDERARQTPRSRELYARAQKVFVGGVTHDGRSMEPHPIYVARAAGPRKWDVDGNEYVDYWSGHGALLLGHNYPPVLEATVAQLQRGTHYGACHELEVRWGELVQQIVPSAERVKLLSSGTEATMMALRLARAFTGKSKIVKIQGHFHGWHDYATIAMQPPYDEPIARGIPRAVAGTMIGVPFQDVAAVRQVLDADPDVAGLILLCNGAGTEYLQALRDLTRERGVALIYDEVVTGFRYAPGGCQEYYGVAPDLTTLAKILAGGMPGGAIGGRADILELYRFHDDEQKNRFGRIPHPGTFNANPVSAAAGIATLEIVRDPAIQRKAAATADEIRAGFDEVLRRRGVEGQAGGDVSLIGIRLPKARVPARQLTYRFRAAMQVEGVDLSGLSLIVSYVHGPREVDQTIHAFDRAIERLQGEGTL